MSAGPDVVCDAEVPMLAADANKWRSLATNAPGMEPHMVVLVDLHSRTEEHLCLQLNNMLDDEGLPPVAFVSHLFRAMRARCIPEDQRQVMQYVAMLFCDKFGHEVVEVVSQQWAVLMEWRAKHVAFAHPLIGNGLNKDSLEALEAAVEKDTLFAPVRAAAHVMLAAAHVLVATRFSIRLLTDSNIIVLLLQNSPLMSYHELPVNTRLRDTIVRKCNGT